MADSLLLDGTDDRIALSAGSFAGTGAITYASVIKSTDDPAAYRKLFGYNALDAIIGWGNTGEGELLHYYVPGGGVNYSTTVTADVADGWVLFAYTSNGVGDQGRFHRYKWSTSGWIHETGSVTPSTPATCTTLWIGCSGEEAQFAPMNVLIAGVWDSELSDGSVEALIAGTSAWTGADEAWRFDTMSSLSTITSGSSTESSRTGTTVDTGDAPSTGDWGDSPGPPSLYPILSVWG